MASTVMIAGEVLPAKSHIWVALTYVYGIGKTTALQICEHAKVKSEIKVSDMSEQDLEKIRGAISDLGLVLGTSLREQVERQIDAIMASGSNRGRRLRQGYPVRGQRTHTNAKTARSRKPKRQKRG